MTVELTTPNNAFRYPTAANNGSNFGAGIADLATDVDAKWSSGTLAARPAAGTRNRLYYATDTGLFYLDTGAAWVQMPLPLSTGVDASKPTPAATNVGQFYQATDSGALYLSDGSTLHTVYGSRGAVSIATSQSTSSASYTTLATPDQVTGIVLPTNGLIQVWYQATWQESVNGTGGAAIFIGANQLKGATNNAIFAQSAGISGSINTAVPLATCSSGLNSPSASSGYPGNVTTGQLVLATNSTAGGGPCSIFAAAGTYTISVKFAVNAGGTCTASNRQLWVQAISFS